MTASTRTSPMRQPDPCAGRSDGPASCRMCGSSRLRSFVDLGATPPCELFLTTDAAYGMEPTYPLHVRVCEECLLAQLPALIPPEETFTDYAHFSSYSSSWVKHAEQFVVAAIERLGLEVDSFVVEVASNDGYLLQHFVHRWIPCLGIEPSVNVGARCAGAGVPTLTAFLTPEVGAEVRRLRGAADLVVANNVYGHVPDVAGFSEGLRALVADDGWVSIEVPHLLTLMQAYPVRHDVPRAPSVLHAPDWPARARLRRSHSGRRGDVAHPRWIDPDMGTPERSRRRAVLGGAPGVGGGGRGRAAYGKGHDGFSAAVSRVRDDLVAFLIDARREGKRVVGYGAPGKGNALLNYCGIRPDLLAYTVDRNPYKHGRLTPGTRIPVYPPERIGTRSA